MGEKVSLLKKVERLPKNEKKSSHVITVITKEIFPYKIRGIDLSQLQ